MKPSPKTTPHANLSIDSGDLIAKTSDEHDREVMRMYVEFQKESDAAIRELDRKNRIADEDRDPYDPSKFESYRRLQTRLGTVPENDPETAGMTAESFVARQSDLVVEVSWIRFTHDDTGLRSLLDWFCQQRCHTIKLEANAFGMFGNFDDEE